MHTSPITAKTCGSLPSSAKKPRCKRTGPNNFLFWQTSWRSSSESLPILAITPPAAKLTKSGILFQASTTDLTAASSAAASSTGSGSTAGSPMARWRHTNHKSVDPNFCRVSRYLVQCCLTSCEIHQIKGDDCASDGIPSIWFFFEVSR